jgi:hypothetical protein
MQQPQQLLYKYGHTINYAFSRLLLLKASPNKLGLVLLEYTHMKIAVAEAANHAC